MVESAPDLAPVFLLTTSPLRRAVLFRAARGDGHPRLVDWQKSGQHPTGGAVKRKDFGLLVALTVLTFMAVVSEKRYLVAEGIAVTWDELEQGRRLYGTFCRSCHETGVNGAPRPGDPDAWNSRLRQEMTILVGQAFKDFHGAAGGMSAPGSANLTAREFTLAVAYIVWQGRESAGEEGTGGEDFKERKSAGPKSEAGK
jgi:cytochrome c5